ncbi:MAG: hypothetical protein ACOYBY_17780, partial [Dermatophilaceae bacterium]
RRRDGCNRPASASLPRNTVRKAHRIMALLVTPLDRNAPTRSGGTCHAACIICTECKGRTVVALPPLLLRRTVQRLAGLHTCAAF